MKTEFFNRASDPFRCALDLADARACFVSAAGDILDATTAFCQIVGYSRDELIGERWLSLISPDDPAEDEAAVDRLLFAQGHTRMDWRLRHRSGAVLPTRATCQSCFLSDGTVCLAIAVTMAGLRRRKSDRSPLDQVQTLQALQESETHYRQLVESANDGFLSLDEDGHIVDWNTSAALMFGWGADEAIGQHIERFIRPLGTCGEFGVSWWRQLVGNVAAPVNQTMAVRAFHRAGHEIPLELSSWEIRRGERVQFCAFMRDISGRTAVEEALKQSEKRYRQVVENVSEGIVVLQDGHVVFANPRAERLAGCKPGALHTLLFVAAVDEQDRAAFLDTLWRHATGLCDESRQVLRLQTSAEAWVWVEYSAVNIDWEGRPATLAFVNDITERKRAEDETLAALRKARELNELKSKFIATTSHEFRTPLATILSSAELLRYYVDKMAPDERARVVGGIESAVNRMMQMLDDVLLIGQSDANRIEFSPKPLSLDEFCDQMAEDARTVARSLKSQDNTRGDVVVELRKVGLPAVAALDEKLLRHIVGNLLANAVKYSPEGGHVFFGVACRPREVEFTVADSGIGMSKEDLPRLFDTFYRASNVGRIAGTGLGLSIVKRSVSLHRGTVKVDSALGQGTRFVVTIPRQDAAD